MNSEINPPTITIALEGVKFHAFHGVFEQERKVGAEFEVSLEVQVVVSDSMRSDRLVGTVSYADLYAVCRSEMEKPSALIEHVALRIADSVRALSADIIHGRIRLRKLHPPIAAFDGSASVTLDF